MNFGNDKKLRRVAFTTYPVSREFPDRFRVRVEFYAMDGTAARVTQLDDMVIEIGDILQINFVADGQLLDWRRGE